MRMTRERAIGLASEWADGHVNTIRNGEAEAYHELFLELLEEKKNRGWISVKDRMPEPTFLVLVCAADSEMAVDAIGTDGEWMSYLDVTHWMLLPEPPEDDA